MQIFPPEPVLEQLDVIPLILLMICYGYVLYLASCTLSKGSAMLLQLYGPGIVGGLVIPILGAIPDGMIILISGLGSGTVHDIQKDVNVGVGTLAGSTIMLLTVPWALGIYLGRRDIDPITGHAASDRVKGYHKPKYTEFTWTSTGVTVFPEIAFLANSMMATVSLYLIIQIPALFYRHDISASSEEKTYASIGFISTIAAFIIYSVIQLRSSDGNAIVGQLQKSTQRKHWEKTLAKQMPPGKSLRLFFKNFDLNGDGYINRSELVHCLKSLGLNANRAEVNAILKEMGPQDYGTMSEQISYADFEHFFTTAVGLHATVGARRAHRKKNVSYIDTHWVDGGERDDANAVLLDHCGGSHSSVDADEWVDDCDEEERAYAEYSDVQIKLKATRTLIIGALLACIFSFPLVTTINVFADKAGINAFYVSFLLTPLASNASEMIAALQFARKRNCRGVSLMFGSLYGSVNMNNTFALSIFLGIITFRGLQWMYTAEVIVILIITWIVGIQGRSRTIRVWQAGLVALLYPASIALIWALKHMGLDKGYHEKTQ